MSEDVLYYRCDNCEETLPLHTLHVWTGYEEAGLEPPPFPPSECLHMELRRCWHCLGSVRRVMSMDDHRSLEAAVRL